MSSATASTALDGRIGLEPLCDLAIDLEPPQVLRTPFGTRLTHIIRSGTATGRRLHGEVLPGGGDWLVLGSDGIGRLDVRATLRTHDGELLHLTATGVAVLPDHAKARLAAGERIAAEEMHMRSQLRFEADPGGRYAWLNAITTVAVNELAPGHVTHRILEVG